MSPLEIQYPDGVIHLFRNVGGAPDPDCAHCPHRIVLPCEHVNVRCCKCGWYRYDHCEC
jgi:hypothetical protein